MSNKKFSRSKKTDGSNVPNFVFNFAGSQPGSPLASPGGFGSNSTPASPASSGFNFGSTTSQPFVFGDPAAAPAASPTTNTSFNFNSSQAMNHPFNTKRGQSELDLAVPEREVLRRAASEMTFSIPTSASTNNGSFNFGTNPVKSTLTALPSFGSTGSQSSSISFSAPGPPATTPTSGITFASPAASSTPTTNITADTGFSFGTPAKTPVATTITPSAPFTFGSSVPTSTAVSTATTTPSFGFASTAATSTDKPTTPATTSASPFASSSAVLTTTPAATGFSFGTPPDAPKTTTATTASPFSINAPIATSKPLNEKPTTTSLASNTTSTTPFLFGTPKAAAATPSATTSTTFNFGSTTATTPAVTASTTTTTSVATTSVAAPTASLFSLGTIAGDKDGKKAGSSITSAPFTFGASTIPTTTPSIPTADPNKPNVFSFSKILDDLAQTAAQPSNQMYASLITPGLAALQQNQIVSHTNFRIDNILSTTRFTELPEQAQKELDELEKYVRLEGQRCEYIGNYKVPQHLNAMDKAKKDTESLSQQLDALSSTLKGQVESIASLYENVKTQLRHANEGCAVIEACKHPGNNARWLFGYSEYDNYFSLLAKQLGGRLEEYQKCIWEIERTAESWSHNRVQSPQDIADIMRAQNQAFLSLSNKVAALHESVNVELNYYNQYLKMYS